LVGSQIPIEARILAVADAYEAMIADRPYRQALSPQIARAELEDGRGRQFDADVVHAFLAFLASEEGARAFKASERRSS
jgi:HD-GYP domain-containing protein (c-di-GMP phosphodiesterase class II)